MVTFVTVIYVLVCVFLILVVLLQAGRGGGMGAAMGGGSQTVFGGAGASNFLQRLTVISATLFMVLSAVLAYMSSTGEKSLEAAAERVRQREEARQVDTPTGKGSAAAAVVDAGLSSPTGDGANVDDDAIPDLEGASEGALDAVDDAIGADAVDDAIGADADDPGEAVMETPPEEAEAPEEAETPEAATE